MLIPERCIWSRQLVHHDIWDYDTNSAPVLVDIDKDGKTIPALVQSSKQGFLYVLNRLTGEPIYPIEEKPVPQIDVQGEQSAPTQPYVATPEPVVPDQWPGVSTLADIASFGDCSRTAAKLRYDGRFTPPSLKGSLVYPATAGGIEWGGGAVDPATDTYVVNSSSVVQIYRLITRADYEKKTGTGRPTAISAKRGALRLLICTISSIAGACRAGSPPTARFRPTTSIVASCFGRSRSERFRNGASTCPNPGDR